jgi:23S rRNA (pseudouridine1915-N3)-methyltransferase
MRMHIVAVGRAASAPEQAICDSCLRQAQNAGKRLGFSAIGLVAVETSRAATASLRMEEEARRLTKRLPAGAHVIALDRKGAGLSSEDFAARLAVLRDSGTKDLVLVIGGPDGLQREFLGQANERLSLGPATWPHLLVRAMLAEQIYRSVAILSGHPYHRGG